MKSLMEQQTDLLKLILQKMEIKVEDEQEEEKDDESTPSLEDASRQSSMFTKSIDFGTSNGKKHLFKKYSSYKSFYDNT
jgi:hypothetical protein